MSYKEYIVREGYVENGVFYSCSRPANLQKIIHDLDRKYNESKLLSNNRSYYDWISVRHHSPRIDDRVLAFILTKIKKNKETQDISKSTVGDFKEWLTFMEDDGIIYYRLLEDDIYMIEHFQLEYNIARYNGKCSSFQFTN